MSKRYYNHFIFGTSKKIFLTTNNKCQKDKMAEPKGGVCEAL
jgi:hypothetical protein